MGDWFAAIATFLAAVAAFLSLLVQQSISKREARRIVLDVYERFFTRDECRRIIREIESQREKDKVDKFWKDLKNDPPQGELTEIDLDEYLGYFELLGALVCRKAVFYEDVFDLFGYYIEVAWEHPKIKEYIEDIRQVTNDPSTYEYFQYIAELVIDKPAKSAIKRIGRKRK
jgi:hypothetical protein